MATPDPWRDSVAELPASAKLPLMPADTPQAPPVDPVVERLDQRNELARLSSRLDFLYRVTEDTQNTIRFLDTKAAFCVTLLSGMVAGVIEHPGVRTSLHHALYLLFMSFVVLSLLVCLRVIFPTIKPSSSIFGSTGPKFYVGHNKAHHWLLHTIKNRVGEVLSETHNSYLAEMQSATDDDLLNSMCDEVLMVALIRQVKSDRLHTAMFCLTATVVLFAAVMMF